MLKELAYAGNHVPSQFEVSEERLAACLGELLDCLPRRELNSVLDDLNSYERTGRPTPRIERLLKRAVCLADADRIKAKY